MPLYPETDDLKSYKSYLAGQRYRYKNTQIILKLVLDKIKTVNPCKDCGNRFPPEAMDFDHVRGKKYRNVSLLTNHRAVCTEILKCELVCSNCHRIRTVSRLKAKLKAKHGCNTV